jgi:hypothetical protein
MFCHSRGHIKRNKGRGEKAKVLSGNALGPGNAREKRKERGKYQPKTNQSHKCTLTNHARYVGTVCIPRGCGRLKMKPLKEASPHSGGCG